MYTGYRLETVLLTDEPGKNEITPYGMADSQIRQVQGLAGSDE